MKMYQVFDQDGRDLFLLTGTGPADAHAKLRKIDLNFTYIVEIEDKKKLKNAILREKESFETRMFNFVEEQVVLLQNMIRMPVKKVEILRKNEAYGEPANTAVSVKIDFL